MVILFIFWTIFTLHLIIIYILVLHKTNKRINKNIDKRNRKSLIAFIICSLLKELFTDYQLYLHLIYQITC